MAEYTVTLVVDSSGAVHGAKAYERSAEDIAKSSERAGRGVDRLQQAMGSVGGAAMTLRRLLAGVGVGFSLGAAINEVVAFERTMSSLKATLTARSNDMAAVSQAMGAMELAARDLGLTTNNSAREAAAGMQQLVASGFSVTQAIGEIVPVMDLADATMSSLGEAARVTTLTLRSFGLANEEAARVADVLAVTSKRTQTDIGTLAQGMSFIASSARGVGLGLEDVSSAMGVMAQRSGSAMRGGMALQSLLAILKSDTKATADAFSEMGLDLGDLRSKLSGPNGLVRVIDALADAQERGAQLSTVFRGRIGELILGLVGQRDALRDATEAAYKAEGAAKRLADVMNDNLVGDVKNAMAAIRTLALSIGDTGLIGVMRGGVQAVTAFVRGLAGIEVALSKSSLTMRAFNALGRAMNTNFELLADAVTIFGAAYTTYVLVNFIKSTAIFKAAISGLAALSAAFSSASSVFAAAAASHRIFSAVLLTSQGVFAAVTKSVMAFLATIGTAGWLAIAAGVIASFVAFRTTVANTLPTIEEVDAETLKLVSTFGKLEDAIQAIEVRKLKTKLSEALEALDDLSEKMAEVQKFSELDKAMREMEPVPGDAWGNLAKTVAQLYAQFRGGQGKIDATTEEYKRQEQVVRRLSLSYAYAVAEMEKNTEAMEFYRAELAKLDDTFAALLPGAGGVESEVAKLTSQLEALTQKYLPLKAVEMARRDALLELGKLQTLVTNGDKDAITALEGLKLTKGDLLEIERQINLAAEEERRSILENLGGLKKYKDVIDSVRESSLVTLSVEAKRRDALKELSVAMEGMRASEEEQIRLKEIVNRQYDEEIESLLRLESALQRFSRMYDELTGKTGGFADAQRALADLGKGVMVKVAVDVSGLDGVRQSAETAAASIDTLAKVAREVGLVDAAAQTVNLTKAQLELSGAILAVSEAYGMSLKDAAKFVEVLGQNKDALAGLVAEFDQYAAQSKSLKDKQGTLVRLQEILNKLTASGTVEARGMVATLAEWGITAEGLSRSLNLVNASLRQQAADAAFAKTAVGKIFEEWQIAEGDIDPFRKWLESADPLVGEVERLTRKLEMLRKVAEEVRLNPDAYKVSATEISQVIESSEKQLKQAQKNLIAGTNETAGRVQAAWDEATRNIHNSFTRMFRDLLDGASNFGEQLKNIIKDAVANVAAAFVEGKLKDWGLKLLDSLSSGKTLGGVFRGIGNVFGMGGASTAAAAGADIGPLGSGAGALSLGAAESAEAAALTGSMGKLSAALLSVKTAFSSFGSGFMAGMGGATPGSLSAAGSWHIGGTGMAPAAGPWATAGATAAWIAGPVGGFLGGRALNERFGGTKNRGNQMALGGAGIGMAFGGPIGALIGGIIGGALSGLLGGKKSVTGAGIELGISEGELTARSYEDWKKRRNLGRSDKRWTVFEDIADEQLKALKDVLDATIKPIRDLASRFELPTDALGKVSVQAEKLKLSGLSPEEQKAKIDEFFQKVFVESISTFVSQTEGFGAVLRDFVMGFKGAADEMFAALEVASSIVAALQATPVEDLKKARETEAMPLRAFREMATAAVDWIRTMDSGNESVARLNDTLLGMVSAAVQLADAFLNLRERSDAMFKDTITMLQESVMTPEQLYESRRSRLDDVVEQLRLATEPQKIASLADEANALLRGAFEVLQPEQRAGVVDEFVAAAETIQGIVGQLADIGLEVVEGDVQRVQQEAAARLAQLDAQQQSITDAAAGIKDAVDTFGEWVAILKTIQDVTPDEANAIAAKIIADGISVSNWNLEQIRVALESLGENRGEIIAILTTLGNLYAQGELTGG